MSTGRKRDAKHEFPWDFYNAMSEAGWIGVAIPEAYGGSGRGITEASIVLETVAAQRRCDEWRNPLAPFYVWHGAGG